MTTFYTQSVDIIFPPTPTDALPFSTDDEIYTIAPNVVVASDPGYNAVSSTWTSSSLINYGSLFSPDKYGAKFTNVGENVFNANSGSITGGDSGIYMNGNGAAIDNRGSIVGYTFAGILFGSGADNIFLQNLGMIYGHFAGVENSSELYGGYLFNAGTIRSDTEAINIDTNSALVTSITNAATGIITSTLGIGIYIQNGGFFLTNHGTIVGEVRDDGGLSDVVVNTGKIQGSIQFGGGNDVFNGKGGTSGAIFGGGGNDRIIGGKGTVSIHVGGGYDTLTAGPGHDRFIFDSSLMGVEKITNFTPVLDKIVLSETYFPGLGPHGTLTAGHFHVGPTVPPNPHIIYTPGNGFLYYDADGTARGTTHFATLTTHPILHNTDFVLIA
jgi:Ca2+-binding RTX toxin-like protein